MATTACAGAVPSRQQTRDLGLTNAHTTTSWYGENKESGSGSAVPLGRRETSRALVLDAEELASQAHTRNGYACIWAEKPWASTDSAAVHTAREINASESVHL